MQQVIYDNWVYTQLTNHVYIDAHSDKWAGIETELNAYSKKYWTSPYMVRKAAATPRRTKGSTCEVGGLRHQARLLRDRDAVRRDHAQLRLFRAVPGDAVDAPAAASAARVQGDPAQELGLDKSKWEQYRLYLPGSLQGDLGKSLRTQKEVRTELWEPLKNTLPMIALGVFAISSARSRG